MNALYLALYIRDNSLAVSVSGDIFGSDSEKLSDLGFRHNPDVSKYIRPLQAISCDDIRCEFNDIQTDLEAAFPNHKAYLSRGWFDKNLASYCHSHNIPYSSAPVGVTLKESASVSSPSALAPATPANTTTKSDNTIHVLYRSRDAKHPSRVYVYGDLALFSVSLLRLGYKRTKDARYMYINCKDEQTAKGLRSYLEYKFGGLYSFESSI